MLSFLSPEWLGALDEAARLDPALATATAAIDLVVEQRVTEPDGSEVAYHVVFDHGRVSVVGGPAQEATVRFRQDRATALAIAAGVDSAQRAFMTGRLQVGGDLRVLLDQQDALAALDDVFAGVRARTDLGAEPHVAGSPDA
ncbi:SCP2 sterol-binding domain-containing protein [Aquihabitans sp. G128]|uniref:SCP2 sterol-binding domain-containing protein n=1 Tax=Aquihabitans sp. G128 TaxID=2849779 RepID=UPI001C222E5F|nr:SCP2 sterol-binding domain-containing protein [Aquihabitans sp. G128]QXC60389.1 SCP2 sterol-binding domain-containing protein [Aquihabitans sp. G128]